MTLSLEESLPDLLFDRDRMNQVIYNLLNNAVRYVPQGRSLTISAATEMEGKTAYLLTEIRDTGDGVPPDRLSHLFNISTAEKPRGTAKAAAAASALPWPVSWSKAMAESFGLKARWGKGQASSLPSL